MTSLYNTGKVTRKVFNSYVEAINSNVAKENNIGMYDFLKVKKLTGFKVTMPQCIDIAMNYEQYAKQFGES